MGRVAMSGSPFVPYQFLTAAELDAALNAGTAAQAAETAARIAGDATGATGLAMETTARIAGDAADATALAAETAARIAAISGPLAPVVAAASLIAARTALGVVGWVTPEQFGAVGDGVTNDAVALQNAINAAATLRLGLWLGNKSYLTMTSLTVASAMTIRGSGKTASMLVLGASIVGLIVTAASPVVLTDFGITPAGGVTGTFGIQFAPATGYNTESIMRDLQLIGLSRCIDAQAAAYFTVDNVTFDLFTSIGLLVRNTSAPDAGDSCVSNSVFLAATTVETGIQQQSSGGLKVVNSKFLNGAFGFRLLLDAGVNTGALLLDNDSFEGQSGAAIQLSQNAAGGTFHSAEITGCQFNLTPQAISVLDIYVAPGWLTDLSISGGSAWINAAGQGINLDGVTGFDIEGIQFHSLGAGVNCINVSAACASGLIHPLNYFGTGIAGYCSNSSPSTTVMPKIITGAGSAVIAAAFGALFAPTVPVAIAFPTGSFLLAPVVTANATSATGVGVVCENITTAGFNAIPLSASNTVTVTFNYSAAGN